MLEDFQGDSWGSIPPLRMSSLLPHDLCHGRSASLWPPTCQHHTTHEKYQSESWMILAFKELTEKWGHMAHKGHRSTLQYKWELARQNLEKRLPDKEKMLTESQLLKSPNSKGMSTVVWIASFYTITGFPDSSVYKESTWNAGDPSSIPGLGRSAGEGTGYPFQGRKESDTTEQLSLSCCLGLSIAFLPRSNCLNFTAAVTIHSDSGAQEKKICHCFHFFPFYFPWSDGTRCHDLSFWMLSCKPAFSLFSFNLIKGLFSSASLSAIRVVSSAYLKLLILLPAMLIPTYDSSIIHFTWCTLI